MVKVQETIDLVQEAIGWLEIALQRGSELKGDARINVRNALGYLRDHQESKDIANA